MFWNNYLSFPVAYFCIYNLWMVCVSFAHKHTHIYVSVSTHRSKQNKNARAVNMLLLQNTLIWLKLQLNVSFACNIFSSEWNAKLPGQVIRVIPSSIFALFSISHYPPPLTTTITILEHKSTEGLGFWMCFKQLVHFFPQLIKILSCCLVLNL